MRAHGANCAQHRIQWRFHTCVSVPVWSQIVLLVVLSKLFLLADLCVYLVSSWVPNFSAALSVRFWPHGWTDADSVNLQGHYGSLHKLYSVTIKDH